jgi:tRNA(Ile)-lysidine synthase
VLLYLEEKGLSHRTDLSNGDNRFFRNAIRNRLIPLLDELYPRWKGTVSALAETQRMTADFLAAQAEARAPWEVFRGGRELRTGAEGFFALPPILREEALFRGIDRLPAGASCGGRRKRGAENPVPVKRSNLRKFYAGEFSALDLGSCRIRRSPSRVILSGAAGKTHEAGFSLLIKAPGLYKLKGLTFELLPVFCPGGGEGFFASLPLLVRRSMSGDRLVVRGRKFGPPDLDAGDSAILCAADASGIAAFIGSGGGGAALLLARGRGPETEKSGGFAGTYYCKVSYTGGVDV